MCTDVTCEMRNTSECFVLPDSSADKFHFKSLQEILQFIVNILFMAQRIIYCSIILLTLELNVEDEYNVSIRQLRTLFTYWCCLSDTST